MTTTTTATAPSPLLAQLRAVAAAWGRHQYQLVVLGAQLADGLDWFADGSPTPAHWLATVADVETCTAREWIRIGRQLRTLPASADAFEHARISYAKVRTLTRLATPANEAELVPIAERTPASHLARELARWLHNTQTPEAVDAHHQHRRSLTWRNDPEGTVTFTARLPPLTAARFQAVLAAQVMTCRPKVGPNGWPTVAQQYADGLDHLLTTGTGHWITELVLHVRGDGCTLDDGTPIPQSILEHLAPHAFIRALIHDADSRPINASGKQRHPTTRQKRVVKERDRVCVDCGRHDLLHYDHQPDYDTTKRTIVDELELRCAPCHHKRHANDNNGDAAG